MLLYPEYPGLKGVLEYLNEYEANVVRNIDSYEVRIMISQMILILCYLFFQHQ